MKKKNIITAAIAIHWGTGTSTGTNLRTRDDSSGQHGLSDRSVARWSWVLYEADWDAICPTKETWKLPSRADARRSWLPEERLAQICAARPQRGTGNFCTQELVTVGVTTDQP